MNYKSFFAYLVLLPGTLFAQFIDTSPGRVKTPLVVNLTQIGTLKPRSTKEIVSSRITVGCETLDRDYTDFDAYKAYLAPLGAKKIRLQAGWAKCEKTKVAYYAVQNVASMAPNVKLTTTATESISAFVYREKAGKKQLVSVWLDSKTPNNLFKTTPITIENGNFSTPVWVDLITGHVYEIPKGSWKRSGTTYTFSNVPVYDSPVLIAEKSLVLTDQK